jgi:DNA-binding protein H-NS
MNQASLMQLSVNELNDLKVTIDHVIEEKKKSERVAVLEEVKAMVAKAGMTLDEVIGNTKSGKRASRGPGKSVAPKYRNPANASETWTGRGRQPKWVADYVSKGHSLSSIQI